MAVKIDASELLEGLASMSIRLADKIENAMQSVAADMESDAKRDAPWTDRTGNARRTMEGFVLTDEDNNPLIGIAGHMSYSPDLELRHGRRYAILVPTVERYIPNILNTLSKAVLRQGGLHLE